MGKVLAMPLSVVNSIDAEYYPAAEWQRFFNIKPRHQHEIIFGFLLRLLVGIFSVIIPSILMMIIGIFNDWQLNDTLLVIYGSFICAMVFFGEHLRSRAYERMTIPTSPPYIEVGNEVGNEPRLSSDAQNRYGAMSKIGRFSKRAFDAVLSLAMLMLLAPLMTVVVLAIKFDSAGPVLFTQKRRTFDGRDFRIYKFRTMEFSKIGSPTTTPVGAFLRRLNLDELPQLFNVLAGDMSIVGPRPLAADDRVSDASSEYSPFRGVRPGITGWAQIHGFRGGQNVGSERLRREYDLWYLNNWTIWLDMRIVFETLLITTRR
jgi:lipopolysaccharide/colanic/teichoic acid biosynthesis glycosyltransferase